MVTTTSPITIASEVPKPSTSTPGSRSSTHITNSAFSTIAPSPSVSTDSGTTRKASAGHTTALTSPTTKPASNASANESMSNPPRIAARNQSAPAMTTVTTNDRQTT